MLRAVDCNEDAIEKYRCAARLRPDFTRVFYSWSKALDRLGRHEEADQMLSRYP
jgi:Flp pilus assembly protein TadD